MPALTVKELVEAVLEDGTFDATEAQALRWLSARQRTMVARSRCFRKTVTIPGGVVYGQASYPLPPGVIEILQVTVGGLVYGHARHHDYAEGERGWLWLGGEGGIAGRDDNVSGEPMLRLFPVPAASSSLAAGAEISLYCVSSAPALVVGIDGTIVVPDEFLDVLISGAIATGMERVESRFDLAKPHEEIFAAGCQELEKATNRRFRGSAPGRARVVGIDA